MPKYTEIELVQEIATLKQQLQERERERESRIIHGGFLVMDIVLTSASL